MSPTKTGWKRVVPATNSGVRKSPSSFIFGSPSKNHGQDRDQPHHGREAVEEVVLGPNTRLGRKTVALGNAFLTAASPAAFERA